MRKIIALLVVLYIGYFAIFRVEDEIAFSTIQAAPSPAAGEFTIPVLTYHSITDQAGSEYEVTAAQFNLQMAYLHSHGYHSISLKQFDTFMKRGMSVPDKLVLITFDDGYRNNYDMAFPILKKYGYTAALFVITDWVNSKPYMSWTQIKALEKGGWVLWRIRAPILICSAPIEGQAAKRNCRLQESQLNVSLKRAPFRFSYPYGHRSQTTMDLVQESGYLYAFAFR